MIDDQTPPQSEDQRRRGCQRSLERTRPPINVPGYRAERFLGAGAFGEVWVARDRNTGRLVAIKFYTHRGGLDWSLLAREVEKLAFLFNDRYVVQLIDVGWDADPPYYVMEYIEQGSLAERLKPGPLPVDEAVNLFREIAIGLVHAHGKGVLHCDLKPANVLLDQDLHPRLADFGQSRMSNEQRPALGTMFYMAPEQADLKAAPDARWDVYALGAVLYCMLTGQPPYRTDEAAAYVSQGADLEEQLQRYVRLLHHAPRPAAHRAVRGVGRDLAEIIDRSLSINPAHRFANPQAVLDALRARTIRRGRRPLLVLGALGPAVLLTVMALFSFNGAETVVGESEIALTQRALESNRFAARFVAESVASQIDQRWYTLEQEASDFEFRRLVETATGQPPQSPLRKELQTALETMHEVHASIPVSAWFLFDAHGNQLGRSPFDAKMIDRNFAFRDYFNGLGHDLEPGKVNVAPLREPHRSHVYMSLETESFSLAFTVPIWGLNEGQAEDQVIGVLGMTVELGHFAVLGSDNAEQNDRVAVLVDTLPDGGRHPRRGLVLEHPLLDRAHHPGAGTENEVHLEQAEVERLLALRKLDRDPGDKPAAEIEQLALQDHYDDPVEPDSGRWLAAFEPVFVRGRPDNVGDTGWVVIVQERFDEAVRPARHLGGRLIERGLLALVMVVAVVTALWGFVIIVLNESPRFLLRHRSPRWSRRSDAPDRSPADQSPGPESAQSGQN